MVIAASQKVSVDQTQKYRETPRRRPWHPHQNVWSVVTNVWSGGEASMAPPRSPRSKMYGQTLEWTNTKIFNRKWVIGRNPPPTGALLRGDMSGHVWKGTRFLLKFLVFIHSRVCPYILVRGGRGGAMDVSYIHDAASYILVRMPWSPPRRLHTFCD